MTDRLTLARAFEDAGIERSKAENVAAVVFDVIRETTATKADLRDAVQQTKIDLRDAVQQLTLRGLLGAASLFFALLGALHYWPPK